MLFGNSSRWNKPIMLLKFLLGALAIFVWIKIPNHDISLLACRFIVSILMLITGIETYKFNKLGKKEYLIWFSLAILFFLMAIDQIFSP